MKELLNELEKEKIDINKDWYYHAFQYNKEDFMKMLNDGIKSRILIGKKPTGVNGNYYVSLSKNINCVNSIYNHFELLPMFIIHQKIRTIKADNIMKKGKSYPLWLMKSFLPFRDSYWDDEYQKFLMVNSGDIIGIQYNLNTMFEEKNMDNIKNKLMILKEMIEILNFMQKNIPIIDSSTGMEIKKENVLSLKI